MGELSLTSNTLATLFFPAADTSGPSMIRLFHLTGVVLAGAVPAGFLTSDVSAKSCSSAS